MKKIITIIVSVVLLNTVSKAQGYVTIPDSNFVTWLNINIPAAMSGNQMDTTHPDILNRTQIDMYADSVYDLTGIAYFTSLQTLDCSFNHLRYIPKLPNSLKVFFCGYNKIDSLHSLPDSLIYFNCRQNFIDSLPELPASLQKLVCVNNQLSYLPTLDSALTHLFCSGNQLTSLPILPDYLHILSCYENQLTTLPTLPSGLDSLICNHNNLSSIPALPSTLTYFDCGENSIVALPSLSAGLEYLDCWGNNLTSLPSLPAVLVELICGNNQITALPILPATLKTLKCYYNNLTGLPVLPSSLLHLDCNNNGIATLPSLPGSLNYLDCSSNQLTSIPTLPLTLYYLSCEYNYISVLPTLPGALDRLHCGNNPLSNLPLLPASLSHLTCEYATLNSLPTLPPSLFFLVCNNNNLTQLPALPANISILFCENNALLSLPTLPYGLNKLHCYNNQISCFEQFPQTIDYGHLILFNNPFQCLPNYIPAMDITTLNYPLCITGDSISNPLGCPGAEGLVGFVYSDVNSNCGLDSVDYRLSNIPMKLYDSSGGMMSQIFTAINGVYDFPQSAGTYTIAVDTTGLPITPVCPSPGLDTTLTLSATSTLLTNINFDFNCKPGFDVGVRGIAYCHQPFPGERQNIHINAGDMSQWYQLNCASGISGIVKIKVSGPVVFDGPMPGALTPSISGDTYTYSISDFGAIDNRIAFNFYLLVDTLAGSGSPICIKISVLPVGTDNNYSNNTMQICYSVVNSHDPNYKETYPKYLLPGSEEWITYTVHFQNTGNAPAHNITIRDTIDSNMDVSTFQVLNYSHNNITSINGNALTIRFPNIMLPDSTVSADSSQGYIQYRIRPKANRPVGTFVYNTAYIYFDYNEPVITNTTTNIFEGSPENVAEKSNENELKIYPNPATNLLTVEYTFNNSKNKLSIIDISGRMLNTLENCSTSKTIININELDNGIYFIVINDGYNVITQKIIKQ